MDSSNNADLLSVLTKVEAWLQSIGNLLPAFGGLLGLSLCIFSAYRLYDHKMSDGFQHRARPGGYIIGFIIGALITIFMVILAWMGGLYGG